MRVVEHAPEITTLALPLPPLPKAAQRAEPQRNWKVVRVEPGQTLGAIFQERGIPAATLHRLLDASPDRQALARLRPGAELAFEQAPDGRLLAFRYGRSAAGRVGLSVSGDQVAKQLVARPVERGTAVVGGKVGRSLFHSARRLGRSPAAINTLADEVSRFDIDFDRDVAASGRFSVV